MTISEMHTAFKLELDKTSSLELPSFELEEIDFWLNRAIRNFVRSRFTGTNKGIGFESNSKRIMDLSTLVVEDILEYKVGAPSIELNLGIIKDDSFIADLSTCSEDLWFIVGEEVNISFLSISNSLAAIPSGNLEIGSIYKVNSGSLVNDGIAYGEGEYFVAGDINYVGTATVIKSESKKQGITQCTIDTYRSHIDDPYSEHILHYEEAKPLRLLYQRYVELITDGNYGIISYNIRYIRKPEQVSIGGAGTDCDLPEHAHDEIVILAANMALENIEQPRYQSHQNELNKVE